MIPPTSLQDVHHLLDAPRLEAFFTQSLKRPTDFVNAF